MQGEVDADRRARPAARPAIYAELLAIYQDLYPALRATFARLAAFRTGASG